MLSVSSPICNSSGAVACILCLVFLRQMPDALSWAGIVLVCLGVTGLAFVEKKYDEEAHALADKAENKTNADKAGDKSPDWSLKEKE